MVFAARHPTPEVLYEPVYVACPSPPSLRSPPATGTAVRRLPARRRHPRHVAPAWAWLSGADFHPRGHALDLPQSGAGCRSLLPASGRAPARLSGRQRAAALFARQRRLRQSPAAAPRSAAARIDPPHRPRAAGTGAGRLAVERPLGAAGGWHRPVHARYPEKPKGLSQVEEAPAGGWLPARALGRRLQPGRRHRPGGRLRTVRRQGEWGAVPVAVGGGAAPPRRGLARRPTLPDVLDGGA